MKKEVKIILFPEEHKSKNGEFFEKLMRSIFEKEGYEIQQNINFTGLEIDLLCKHKRREETLLVECKAKQKPLSTEIKNFAFNVLISKKADFGYFVHTEELDHQAAGVVETEILNSPENKKRLTFLGPKEIIDILTEMNSIIPIEQKIMPKGIMPFKCILVYSYFGLFYILLASDSSNLNSFYVFDAVTLDDIPDLAISSSERHSPLLTYEQVFKSSISELKDKSHKKIDSKTPLNNLIDIPQTFADINEDFLSNLNTVGINFSHSNVDEIKLLDIFVAPDLKCISYEKTTRTQKYENLIAITEKKYLAGVKYVILGEEASGRSTICKYLFLRYYSQGYLPVLIPAKDIENLRTDAIIKLVSIQFRNQYTTPHDFHSYPNDKILLIIDDFHKIPNKNREFWGILVNNINIAFINIVITGSSLMPLGNFVNKKNKLKQNIFQEYDLYTISEFGHKLRNSIINKWNSLGIEENLIDKNELYRKNDAALHHVQSIIGNNYIPAYPFYILTILQALETGYSQNQNYSLHGFYYELIINDALSRAVNDKKEISLYYNYLTFFCYFLFEQKTHQMSIFDFREFHKVYCEKYDIKYSYEKILSSFHSAKLVEVNGVVSVPHKYVYYFFVAKFLTNNINNPETKEIIAKICARTYRDEYASIIMFLTHLSKDEFIISTLLTNAKSIFSDYPIAQLGDDIAGINALIKALPHQVIKQISAGEARDEEIDNQDEIEKIEHDFEEQTQGTQDYDLDEDINAIDIFAKINLAFKTVELLGQVAKKYWGEMTGAQKYNITVETYFLGLRTLGFYLTFVQESQDALIIHIKNIIEKKHIQDQYKLKKSVEETSNDFIFRLCFLASWGTIKKITGAVGYEKLDSIYEAILDKNDLNSIKLINLSIKLDHYDRFPTKEIEKGKKDFEKNNLSYMLLKSLVINYLYMFDTSREVRQKICSMLGIQVKEQLRITKSSKIKKS